MHFTLLRQGDLLCIIHYPCVVRSWIGTSVMFACEQNAKRSNFIFRDIVVYGGGQATGNWKNTQKNRYSPIIRGIPWYLSGSQGRSTWPNEFNSIGAWLARSLSFGVFGIKCMVKDIWGVVLSLSILSLSRKILRCLKKKACLFGKVLKHSPVAENATKGRNISSLGKKMCHPSCVWYNKNFRVLIILKPFWDPFECWVFDLMFIRNPLLVLQTGHP